MEETYTTGRIDHDKNELCLLSLDGGGVRGLSTLYILKELMMSINDRRRRTGLRVVKPCDIFDLIGGISTGGIIAIMLGRLEMDVEQCIQAYTRLMREVFSTRKEEEDWLPGSRRSFSSKALETAIKSLIATYEDPENALLKIQRNESRTCRVFVCAARRGKSSLSRIRSYSSLDYPPQYEDHMKIWQAAISTSAASSFFDSARVKPKYRSLEFDNSRLNNPVGEVWAEAQNIWAPHDGNLEPMIKSFVSIGIGYSENSRVGVMSPRTSLTLEDIARSNNQTALQFENIHRDLFDTGRRYFRFNVTKELETVGLEERKYQREISMAANIYLHELPVNDDFEDCVLKLSCKELRPREEIEHYELVPSISGSSSNRFSLPFALCDLPEINYSVGRGRIISMMKDALHPLVRPMQKVVVLHGLGGIGKTQIALLFAKRHQEYYKAILWFNAENEDRLKQSFARNAKRLPDWAIHSALLNNFSHDSQDMYILDNLIQAVKDWLSLHGNYQWLMVFDGFGEVAYDIKAYFPFYLQGSIIITTRRASLGIGKTIEVPSVDKKESMSILIQTSGRADLEREPDVWRLVETLHGLPLALGTAGTYLRLASISITEYLQRYHHSWSDLQQSTPNLLSYGNRTLYFTWNLSYNHILQDDEAAARLIQLWAYFDNQDIWFDLLAAGSNKPDWLGNIVRSKPTFNAAMQRLCNYSLAHPLKGSDGYGMHPCVHAWSLNVLSRGIDKFMIGVALNCVSSAIPINPLTGDLALQRRLLPHADRFLQLFSIWRQFNMDGQVGTQFDGDDFQALGLLFHYLGKLNNAQEMLQLALDTKMKALWSGDPSILNTLYHLGLLYKTQGRLEDAESMFQRALNGFHERLERQDPLRLRILNNLGALYTIRRFWDKAELMLCEALVGYEQYVGHKDATTLNTVKNLGLLYNNQGRLEEAKAMYERALAGYEEKLGSEHPSTLTTLGNLSSLYASQGRLVDAEEMNSRAWKGLEKVLGPDHTSTLDVVNNQGNLYVDQGRWDEAEAVYQKVLNWKQSVFGSEHSSTLSTMNNLAGLYIKQGKPDRAQALYQQTLAGYEKTVGPEHTSTLSVVNNLGILYGTQGKLDQAETMLHRALTMTEKFLGEEHPFTTNTVHNLGVLYYNQGKLDESEGFYMRALRQKEKALGSNHISVLNTIDNLATIFGNQGRLDESEAMYWRLLAGYENALGSEHISTLDAVHSLANSFSKQRKLEQAEAMYKRALAGYAKALGIDHTSTLNVTSNLANVCAQQGKFEDAVQMKMTVWVKQRHLSTDEQLAPRTALTDITSILSDRNDVSVPKDTIEWQKATKYHEKWLGRNGIELNTAYSRISSALNRALGSDRQMVEFTLFWDVPKFRSQECSEDQWLGSVIVLSGNGPEIQATTCASYLDENWPGLGRHILNAIVEILADKSQFVSGEHPSHTLKGMQSNGNLTGRTDQYDFCITKKMNAVATLCCYAQHEIILSFMDVLSWICTALQTSHFESPSKSHTLLGKDFSASHPRIMISFSELQAVETHDAACWYTLLPRSVVAICFPIRSRNEEKGLELPFEVMVSLSGIFAITENEGKYYFMGLHTALVPVQTFGEESIQWHLIRRSGERPISRLDLPQTSVLQAENQASTLESMLFRISKRRHFLGWCDKAHIKLGTKDAKFTPQRTETPEESRSVRMQSFGAAGGTSGMGIFSLMFNTNFVVSQSRIQRSEMGSIRFETILELARRTPYIVYDTDTKRAWLVPAICLILHMIHLRVQEQDIDVDVPFAESCWDGGQAAYEVMMDHHRRHSILREPLQPFPLESMVQEVWVSLMSCEQTPAKWQPNLRHKLRAYELMDIAVIDQYIRLKYTEVYNTGGWIDLTKTVERVLICHGIGEAISRVSRDGSVSWQIVPDENHFLCATAESLNRLSSRIGSTHESLSEDLRWHYSGTLQNMVSTRRTRTQPPNPLESSAFIFGGELKNKPKLQFKRKKARSKAVEGVRTDSESVAKNTASSRPVSSSQVSSSRASSLYSLGGNPPLIPIAIRNGKPRIDIININDLSRTNEIKEPQHSNKGHSENRGSSRTDR